MATAVAGARAAGLATSVDLIYGTPGESLDDWRASLDAAVALGPDHVSAYALVVEEGTRLAAQVLRGEAMDRHYGLGRFSPSPQSGTDLGSGSSPVSVASSGSDLDWAQLVAGLGIGVLLGTGLLVAIRVTRARPVGH